MTYKAVVMGVSAGGLEALQSFFRALKKPLPVPLFIVQHRKKGSDSFMEEFLSEMSLMEICEVYDKMPIKKSSVYIAPPDYHMLIENEHEISLNSDEPQCFARPSVDALFESAADVYGQALIGIVLTGANSDGTEGLRKIKMFGGLTIVQDPKTASSSFMPASALEVKPDYVFSLEEIAQFLLNQNY